MASPVVAGTAESSTSTAGTSHVLDWTGLGTVAASDLLLIIMDIGSTAATLNAHADYTELLDENLANGLKILYRQATGGETAPTFVTSASTRSAEITYRITGAANPATQAPQIGTTSSGTSATPDPPASATPPSSKDYLFITFYGAAGEEADDDTWSDTSPTNYTPSPPRQKSCGIAGTNLGGLIAAAERALTTGVAENPSTFAKDVSVAWRGQTIMVHPIANVLVTVPVVATTTARFVPVLKLAVIPPLLALASAAFAPVLGFKVIPPVTALASATLAPVLGLKIIPPVAARTTTTFAPTVTVQAPGTLVTVPTATLTTTRFAPVIRLVVIPPVKTLTVTRFAPTLGLGVVPSVAAKITLANRGWESGAASPGWVLSPGSFGGEASVVTTDPLTGTFHLNLLKNGSGSQSVASYTNAIDPTSYLGATVVFTVYAKAVSSPTTNLELTIGYTGSAEPSTTAAITAAANGGVYKAHSVTTVPIPTDCTDLSISIATSGGGGGRWRVDEMDVTGPASLTIRRFAPLLQLGIIPGVGTLVATRFAPVLHLKVTPGTVTLSTARFSPLFLTGPAFTPLPASLILTTFIPYFFFSWHLKLVASASSALFITETQNTRISDTLLIPAIFSHDLLCIPLASHALSITPTIKGGN